LGSAAREKVASPNPFHPAFIFAAHACAVAAQRKPGAAPNANVAGLWEGTAVNHYSFLQMERTRCHAVVNITLTMIPKGSKVGGFYECRRSTMSCRTLDDSGGIENGAVPKAACCSG
jgi:hypothetical protein